MIMGSNVSSAKLTRAMQILLEAFGDNIAYFVDDIFLCTRDNRSHLDLIRRLLRRFKWGGMTLSPKKCQFLKEEVEYLGVTLTKEGIRINQGRVEKILQLKPPTNKGELQSVLGIFNFSKRFIKSYSDIARPLYNLLRKNRAWEWTGTGECETAFQSLKNALVTAPVLAFIDVEDPWNSYELQLDGSCHAYGATLTQIVKGERKVVAYFSRAQEDLASDKIGV
jgi:hypothetical protein